VDESATGSVNFFWTGCRDPVLWIPHRAVRTGSKFDPTAHFRRRVHNILQKLEVSRRGQAAAHLIRL